MFRALIALIFVSSQVVYAQSTNLISNGDFSQGFKGWKYDRATDLNIAKQEFESQVTNVGHAWSHNLSYGLALKSDTEYTLSFRAKASVAREIFAGWGLFYGSWRADVQSIQLTENWQTFEISGQASFGTEENSRVIFDYGHQLGTVYIDDVVFVEAKNPAMAATPLPSVTPASSLTPEPTLVVSAEPKADPRPTASPKIRVIHLATRSSVDCSTGELCACKLGDGGVRLLLDDGGVHAAPKFSVGQGSSHSTALSLVNIGATDSEGTRYWFDDRFHSYEGDWVYFNVHGSTWYPGVNGSEFLYLEYDRLPVCVSSTSLPTPTPTPTPKQTPVATPEQTPTLTPQPTPEGAPEPTLTVTPEARPSSTPESTPVETLEEKLAEAPNTISVSMATLMQASASTLEAPLSEQATSLDSAATFFEWMSIPDTDSQAPSQPQNFVAQNYTATSVYLSWTSSTDNLAVTEYDIYQNGLFIASTDRPGINVEFLNQNTDYSFYVQALDAAGNVSVASQTVFVTTDMDEAISIFPWVYNDLGNNGAWSWSNITISGGSVIEAGTELNEVKTTDLFSYEGRNSVELHFTHNGTGLASANLTTNAIDPGYEPGSAVQRDAPKDVSEYSYLRFHIMGEINSSALINLTDKNGVSSRAINIGDYSTINSQWQEVIVPLVDFGLTVDLSSLHSVNVLVNDLIAAGEWTFYIDKMEFVVFAGESANPNQRLVDQLCGNGSVDSDGDSICDTAEIEFGTDIMNTDTDGDRLSDAAELLGVPGVDLWQLGANPLRSDIFLEMDFYENLQLDPQAIEMVIDAFANASVTNVDGSTGIALHIDESDAITGSDLDMDLNPVDTDFERIKSKYFTPERVGIFHYCLVANGYNGGISSGLSFGVPGTDFILTMGKWNTPGGTMIQQAGTLMHELGHNLGLHHGGQDDINYKTNYFSVMNYHYQLSGLPMRDGSLVLDYSSYHINEIGTSFNEFDALSGYNGTTEADLDQFWVKLRENDVTYHLDGSASSNLDYNRNANIEASTSSNYTPAVRNDWETLIFSGSLSNPIGDKNLGVDSGSHNKLGFDVNYETAECITEDHESH